MIDDTHPVRGKKIKGYELLSPLGAGGMGMVYRAHQAVVQRDVAIKIILPEYANDPDFIRHFEAEAQLVARLEHPFIVPLFDYWRDLSGAYLVTRFFQGGSLRYALERRGKFDLATTRRALDQLCGALAVAHRAGVIHRDLKPENILLDDADNFYLSDFGIAKRLNEPDEDDEDVFTGSPAYVPPEQIRGGALMPQTDLYSLGFIIHEMLTGRHAYESQTPTQFLIKHLNDDLPDSPELPYELNQILKKTTAKNPTERYTSATALAAAFDAALNLERTLPLEFGEGLDTAALLNPYKGLRPFEEADSIDFFGREDLSARLLERISEPNPVRYERFLAVVGPSGSGKSSVVKAGVLPHLRTAGQWFIAELTPGGDPFAQLESALLTIAVNPVPNVAARLRNEVGGLAAMIDAALPTNRVIELLLVMDQFEELFTQVASEPVRKAFLAALHYAVVAPNSRLRLIITLRADFYDRPLLYDGFGALLRERSEVVLPLSSAELERVIGAPAEQLGMFVEPGLVAAIVADVGEQPGALPLVQYALTELFNQREGALLTTSAYMRSGGISGALARRAEDTYNALPADHQIFARQLFLRLVTLGDNSEDTRRRIRWGELMALGDTHTVQATVDAFAYYRLLTFDHDNITREPTVEVAHEALIRRWSQLRSWLDDNRAALQLQRALMSAAAEWRAGNQDASFLLRGARLTQFEVWQASSDLGLTPDELAYLQASSAQHQAEAQRETERADRERASEARERQRLRQLVGVMAVAVLVALGLAGLALNQTQVAQTESQSRATQQAVAERRAAESQSLLLVNQAQSALTVGQTDYALALAVEAVNLPQPPAAAQRMLYDAAFSRGIISRLVGHNAGVTSVALNPDGSIAFSGDASGELILWDMTAGAELRRVSASNGHNEPVTAIAFAPDGVSALTVSRDGRILLWDIASGTLLRPFERGNSPVNAVAFSPDGTQALTGDDDSLAILWDVASGTPVLQFAAHTEKVNAVAFSPDGTRALTGSDDQRVLLWDLTTGALLREFTGHSDWVFTVAFSPDATQALSGAFDDTMRLWDTETGALIQVYTGHTDSVQALGFVAGGTQLVS
ncbi:MAG: protein kinase, partial [Armatimonadetes bacterium]|nr:protein kinase [Anaerolineae bacterium]